VYLSIVTDHLGSIVPYFQNEGKAVRSPQVRNLVDEELPAVQQLLTMAKGLNRQDRAEANVRGKNKRDSDKKDLDKK